MRAGGASFVDLVAVGQQEEQHMQPAVEVRIPPAYPKPSRSESVEVTDPASPRSKPFEYVMVQHKDAPLPDVAAAGLKQVPSVEDMEGYRKSGYYQTARKHHSLGINTSSSLLDLTDLS
jgi:hypothetical protein